MKKILIITLLGVTLALVGCVQQTPINTGVRGNMEYGMGDCMPGPNREKKYIPYNGDLLIIKKSIAESLTGQESKTQLISLGKIAHAKNGKYEISLDPGDYVINLANEGYDFNHNYAPYNERLLTISKGEVIEKDIKFFVCTTY